MTTLTVPRWLLLGICFILALSGPTIVAAQEGSEGPATQPFPAAGAPIYQARCANCHGPAGQGGGPQAVDAGLAVPDLTAPGLLRETTPARWFDIISNGVAGKAMPPFGEASSNPLPQAERWDLVFYLYTLGTPPAQVAMGQVLYEMSCTACHGPDGAGGGGVTSDLTDPVTLSSRRQNDLFAAITDTQVEGHDLGLGEVEVWALAAYVRTFSYNYDPSAIPETATTAAVPAATSPFTGGAGVVSGRVVNGTAGAPAPAGLKITLRAFDMNANFVDSITTTVSSDGSFRFEGIDPTVPVQMEPLATYQNVPYFGDSDQAIVLSPDRPEASVNITVHETTQDPGAIRVERLHIVFGVAAGQIQVAELYILSNDGDQTYVGTLEEGTLRLTVPADVLGFQPGGDPNRYLTLADGIADTVPIPPGSSTAESVLVYDMAYDGDLELSRPMPYDVNKINIFVPAGAGIEVTGDAIQPGGSFQAQDTALDTYQADNLSAGDRLTMRLSGDPQVGAAPAVSSPRQRPGPSDTQGIVIGLITVAGAAALSYLYWLGRLRPGFGTVAQDQQSALLQAMADLDEEYEAGRVKNKPYQTRRAKLKEALVELIEMEGKR